MRRAGVANLPLHGGKAPRWLFSRMVKLARVLTAVIVEEFGPSEMLARISDPYWFQAFGCVLGFDWHSSGVTTTVCGALKEAVKGHEGDFGLFIAGGKGRVSRRTPEEIKSYTERYPFCLDSGGLIYYSRMSAKIDSAAIQDGYQLYHHNFFFVKDGDWAVVQQGMNTDTSWARRYHWLSRKIDDLVCEPHSAIVCDNRSRIFNMVASESASARDISSAIARNKPGNTLRDIGYFIEMDLPKHHALGLKDVKPQNLSKVLLSTYESQPKKFEELLSIPGVGPKTIRALALLSELVYGARVSTEDPASYSFAHGGKDGYPYPVNRRVYDQSIEILQRSIREAKLGHTEKKEAFKRLYNFSFIRH
ncbi:MAG: DUF763 domain-containing protein [Candidatus Omnitrophica bacterium]|nr:DUF763 domain-containing protein [Candidatus Omnitrophota bacterium]